VYIVLELIDICYALLSGENVLIAKLKFNSNCTCEGYDQVYECRVTGSGATVWNGSAFNCPATNNDIHFFHSSSGIETTCNDGAIVGRTIRAENNTYISQLTVSVSTEMISMNVSCFHDSGATQELIGSSRLTLSRGNSIVTHAAFNIYIVHGCP
jgi:hypothetical protein